MPGLDLDGDQISYTVAVKYHEMPQTSCLSYKNYRQDFSAINIEEYGNMIHTGQ